MTNCFIKNLKKKILIWSLTRYWRQCLKKWGRTGSALILFLLALYNSCLSAFLGHKGVCRFYPSCGEYAFLAYKNLSFSKATVLVLKRLWDCRPFGPAVRNEPCFLSTRKQVAAEAKNIRLEHRV